MRAGSRPDAHLHVVGPRSSGKSTLLNKYIQPDKVSMLTPSICVTLQPFISMNAY